MPHPEDHGPDAAQSDAGEQALAAFRVEITAQLDRLLPRRDANARIGIMGAGSDDLESGRAYLTALAEGGYAVPTWPKQHGGMGVTQAEAGAVQAALAAFQAPDMYPFLVGLDLIGPTI